MVPAIARFLREKAKDIHIFEQNQIPTSLNAIISYFSSRWINN